MSLKTLQFSFFDKAFPFHLAISGGGKILRVGPRLREIAPSLNVGDDTNSCIRFIRPNGITDFTLLKKHEKQLAVLEITSIPGLKLRGELFLIEEQEEQVIMLLCLPWIQDLQQLKNFNLGLHDFPPGVDDMLMNLHLKSNEERLSRRHQKRMAVASEELEKRNRALEKELLERQRLEQTLIQSQKMQAIGQLAGGIAHDFNNILLSIDGHAQLAQIAPENLESTTRHLDRIREATRRASEITARLLSFGRRTLMSNSEIKIAAAISEAQGILSPLLGESIVLEFDIGPGAEMVYIDPAAFQQILVNLAINARDAMDHNGTIIFNFDKVMINEAAELRLGTILPGEYIRVTVRDEGVGMTESIIEQIFEPFFTTKDASQGTGLGLSTIVWILERCDGAMDVASEPGVGTTFSLFLQPCDHTNEVVSTVSQPQSGVEPGLNSKIRILVVEDEDDVRDLVHDMLRHDGYQVVVARHGEEALELIGDESIEPFNLILSDIVMPRMTGHALKKSLQEMGIDVPFALMTGYDPDRTNFSEKDSTPLLRKPFNLEELRKMLHSTLRD